MPTTSPPSSPLDVVLHVGSGKTGTSSIQYFLHRNRARLADLGYLYPQSPGRRRHTRLGLFVQPDKALSGRPSWSDSGLRLRRRFGERSVVSCSSRSTSPGCPASCSRTRRCTAPGSRPSNGYGSGPNSWTCLTCATTTPGCGCGNDCWSPRHSSCAASSRPPSRRARCTRTSSTPRKTRNTTTEQFLDPARLDHLMTLLELPQRTQAPLRQLVEHKAKVR